MRGDEAVLRLQQRVVAAYGLSGDDVQTGGVDLAGVEGVCQGLLVHERAARVVQQYDPVLHPGDVLTAYDAARGWEERTVQGYDVGARKQLVELDVVGYLAARVGRTAARGEDVHTQRLRNAAGLLPDAAEADDAHRLAVQLYERVIPIAPVGAALPAPCVHRLAVVGDVVAYLEQHGYGELSHGRRAVGRDVADRDAAGSCRSDVHYVVARGEDGDVLERAGGIYHFRPDGRLVGDDDVRAFYALGHFALVV